MADDVARKPEGEDDAESPLGVGIIRARDVLGELVNRAGFGGERIVLTRNGKQTAALVGMKDLERLKSLDARPEVAV